MAGLIDRIKDRFKPGVFDRLKQSKEAKEATKEKLSKPPLLVDVETHYKPPVPGAQLESVHRDVGPTGSVHNKLVWRAWNMHADTGTIGSACTGSNNDIWVTWNSGVDVTNSATTGEVWYDWNRQALTATSTQSLRIWQEWVDMEQPRIINPGGFGRAVETAEQRRAREDQEAAYWRQREADNALCAQRQREIENKRKEAEDRAMKLLVSMLNDEQKADLKRDKHFFVEAPSGRLYRIDYGTHGNVKVVDRNTRKIVERLCIQPNGVPAGDANLMQKLLIETAEDMFRAHANITLENGNVVHGVGGQLDGAKLAEVIPIRRAA